jgi:hypothetical protein
MMGKVQNNNLAYYIFYWNNNFFLCQKLKIATLKQNTGQTFIFGGGGWEWQDLDLSSMTHKQKNKQKNSCLLDTALNQINSTKLLLRCSLLLHILLMYHSLRITELFLPHAAFLIRHTWVHWSDWLHAGQLWFNYQQRQELFILPQRRGQQ